VKSVAFLLAVALLVSLPDTLGRAQRTSPTASNEYVTGKVTSASSTPVRSVWVVLYEGSSPKSRSLTGDDGRYYIGRLDRRTYTIIVRRQIAGSDLFKSQVSLPRNRVFDIRLP